MYALPRFFTFWGLAAHALFAVGLLPSTFSIACVVCAGGVLFNVFWNKQYDLLIDVALHYVPVVAYVAMIRLGHVPAPVWRWDVLVGLGALYMAFHSFDTARICTYYRDSSEWMRY